MRRIAILIAGLIAGAPLAAQATCQGVDARKLASEVPYFHENMDASPGASGPAIVSFVHRDDARIKLEIRTQSAVETAPVTRGEFIKDLRDSLRDSNRGSSGGNAVVSVVPYDPVTWTVQRRAPSGSSVASTGSMTIQQSPTCLVVAAWSVFETPVLMSRIEHFTSALETLRYRVAEISRPVSFLPEVNVPAGRGALAYGLGLPLLAAFAIGYGMRRILLLESPGKAPRRVAGIGAAVTTAALIAQMPSFLDGFADLRFTDVAILLGATSCLMLATAVGAAGTIALAAFSLGMSSGVALVSAGAFGWTPLPWLSMVVGLLLAVGSAWGVWSWLSQPVRRVGVPREGRLA